MAFGYIYIKSGGSKVRVQPTVKFVLGKFIILGLSLEGR